jgi:DNA modification methylase
MSTRTKQEVVRASITRPSGSETLVSSCAPGRRSSAQQLHRSLRPTERPGLIRVNGRTLRAEQKSVKLLHDIMRLFAPKPTDIVVDLFAGTMSTVIAALIEGHRVHGCEKDPECFKVGEARVRNFQYRCGAPGLISGLSTHQITLLRSVVPEKICAPDSLMHEPDTYETDLAEVKG